MKKTVDFDVVVTVLFQRRLEITFTENPSLLVREEIISLQNNFMVVTELPRSKKFFVEINKPHPGEATREIVTQITKVLEDWGLKVYQDMGEY